MNAAEHQDILNSIYVRNRIVSIFYPINLYLLANQRLPLIRTTSTSGRIDTCICIGVAIYGNLKDSS